MIKKIIILSFLILLPLENVFAQIYDYFGRNKVQYTKFGWKVLDLEHFDIYFYPEMKELAEIGANFAEGAFEKLEDRFNHTVDIKIPLIFYSSHLHFQQTNVIPSFLPEGVLGFFEYLKGRVVIPNQGSVSKFERVINHELVHVFMQSKLNSIFNAHKQFSKSELPLWFSEGLAEAWSGEWDMQAEMVIRDAVLSGYLVPITNIQAISGSYLMYKEGENFIRFLSEKYGEDRILLLIENYWKTGSINALFKLTFNEKSFKELNDEWVYQLKKRYYPIIESEEIPSMSAIRITNLGNNGKPIYYKSDNGDEVLFMSNRTGYTNIYAMNLNDTDEKRKPKIIIKGERTEQFETFHLFQSKIDVSKSSLLTFVTKSGEKDLLYIYDLKKRMIVNSFQFKKLVSLSSPCWSPDEKRILFSGLSEAGKRDLYIFNIENEELIQLTDDFYDDNDPSWSKDGRYIAFSSDRTEFGNEGYYNLFLYDLKNNTVNYITYGEHNDYAPNWSPDNKYIAFSSDREKSTNIWAITTDFIEEIEKDDKIRFQKVFLAKNSLSDDSNNSNIILPVRSLKKLTNMVTATFDPSWTEDGLLFTSFEKFGFQIQLTKNIQKKLSEKGEEIPSLKKELTHTFWSPEKIPGTEKNTSIYKKRYKLDIAQGQISQDPLFGTMGGTAFAISDMLGNDHYNVIIYNNSQTNEDFFNSFNFALTRLSLARRMNFLYGLFHFDYRYYTRYLYQYDEEIYGGFFTLRYPISQFKRIEENTTLASSDRRDYTGPLYRRKAFLMANFGSFVKDNSLWGPTGPLDGERYMLTLGYTTDLVYSNVGYWSIDVDYRRYFRISLRSALALRAMMSINYGREPQRFYMGGSWDLRGYGRFSLWGNRLGLLSTELRYPLIDELMIRFPFGGLNFYSLRGALFLDMGNAWTDNFDGLLGSVGTGIRFGLGFFVIRLDVGKRIENNFKSFQKGLFTQFFFGWDF